jgi:hypothetical protein
VPPTQPRGRKSAAERAQELIARLDEPQPIPAMVGALALGDIDLAHADLAAAAAARHNHQPITEIKASARARKRLQRASNALLSAIAAGSGPREPTPTPALFHDALDILERIAQDIDDVVERFEHARIEAGRERELIEDPDFASLLGGLVAAQVSLKESRIDLERRYHTAAVEHTPQLPRTRPDSPRVGR